MDPKIDRLACADCAHIEDAPRARSLGEEFPAAAAVGDERAAPCCGCGGCGDAASAAPAAASLSRGELDALHFRFWSADRRRFDHIGFADAVLAACARRSGGPLNAASSGSRPAPRRA